MMVRNGSPKAMKYEFNRHIEVMLSGFNTDVERALSPRGFYFGGVESSAFVEVCEFETEQDEYWTTIRTPCLARGSDSLGAVYYVAIHDRDKSFQTFVDKQRLFLGDRFAFITTNEHWRRFTRA